MNRFADRDITQPFQSSNEFTTSAYKFVIAICTSLSLQYEGHDLILFENIWELNGNINVKKF